MERTTVQKTLVKTLGISAAAALIAMFAYGASAQDKKAEPAKKEAAAKKPPACKTIKKQADCEGRTDDCSWVGESKDDKGKVKAKAYCRSKPAATKK